MNTPTSLRLGLVALAFGALLHSAARANDPVPGEGMPEVASYAVETEIKLLSDRKTRGVSDTFNGPGATLTVEGAHETGLVLHAELGTVSRKSYSNSNRLNPMLALGWRGGDPDGWHYGGALAREWFTKANVDAPYAFVETMSPIASANTKFHTSYAVLELGYSIVTARYMNVLSQDFRGNNTATICGTYSLNGAIENAMNCYADAAGTVKHSKGSHLLDVDVAYPLNNEVKLLGHVGYQKVRNFRGLDSFDYSLGAEYSQWGFTFGASIAGAELRDNVLAIGMDEDGNTKKLNRTALILSVAKRF